MSGRIFAIISLFVVLAVTTAQEDAGGAEEEEGGGKCLCDLFWSRKDIPTRGSVTFEIGEMEVNGVEGEGDSLDCDVASVSCLERCESYLEETFYAKRLSYDRRFRLGKMLCEKENVGISYLEPRHIFMKTIVEGCEDVYKIVSLGDLCCISCGSDVIYNKGCKSEPTYWALRRPGVTCIV